MIVIVTFNHGGYNLMVQAMEMMHTLIFLKSAQKTFVLRKIDKSKKYNYQKLLTNNLKLTNKPINKRCSKSKSCISCLKMKTTTQGSMIISLTKSTGPSTFLSTYIPHGLLNKISEETWGYLSFYHQKPSIPVTLSIVQLQGWASPSRYE